MDCTAVDINFHGIFDRMPAILNNVEAFADFMLQPLPGYQYQIIQNHCAPRMVEICESVESIKLYCEAVKEKLDESREKNIEKINILNTKLQFMKTQIILAGIEIEKVDGEKTRAEKEKDNAEDQLQKSRQILSQAQSKLDRARNDQTGVLASSVTLLVAAPFALILGPMSVALGATAAGSTLLFSGLTVMEKDIENKRDIACDAVKHKNECIQRSSEVEKRLQRLQTELDEKKKTAIELNEEKSREENSKSEINLIQQKISELLKLFTPGVHQLTIVSGRSRVLSSQSKNAYNLNHLKPLFTAFLDSLVTLSTTELFTELNISRNLCLAQIECICRKVSRISYDVCQYQLEICQSQLDDIV